MSYWLTIKPLTEGILEVSEDRIVRDDSGVWFWRIRDTGRGLPPLPEKVKEKDFHTSLESAQRRVAQAVSDEIQKLNSKIEKLGSFKPHVSVAYR